MVLGNLRRSIGERLIGSELRELSTRLEQEHNNVELLHEGIADLELALEDAEWMRLGLQGNQEFSREGLRKISQLARLMYLKNPLIKRGVEVKQVYVWGQGINIRAGHPEINKVIQDFLDDERNQKELTSHEGYLAKQTEEETDGNIFLVFFINAQTGRVRIGSIPFEEIEDVLCSPEDSKEPWFYKRVWQEKQFNPGSMAPVRTVQKTAWYPDWRYQPAKRTLAMISGHEIRWDEPVYHWKTGGFGNWKFGVPELYAAIDWGKAYKEFLEDVATLMRAYSRFAWRVVTKGGKKGVAAAKAKLATTLSTNRSETNPAPTVGATFLGGEGTDLQPLNVRGASVSPDDGRRLLLMVAAAVGLPESFFGDVSVGTLATARSLDRPTELKMRSVQTKWKDRLSKILRYVLVQAVKAPLGELSGFGHIEYEVEGHQRRERLVWNETDDEDQAISGNVEIDFPPLIEEDVKARIDAIVAAATLGTGAPAGTIDMPSLVRMLLNALGEDDVDEKVSAMFPDGDDEGAEGNALAAAGEVRRVFETFFAKWNGQALSEHRLQKSKTTKSKATA